MEGCAALTSALLFLSISYGDSTDRPLTPVPPQSGVSIFDPWLQRSSQLLDDCFQSESEKEFKHLLSRFRRIESKLFQLAGPSEIQNQPKSLVSNDPQYGKIPEVFVDQNRLFTFPRPERVTQKFSWRRTFTKIKKAQSDLAQLSENTPSSVNLSALHGLRDSLASLSEEILYLQQWSLYLQTHKSQPFSIERARPRVDHFPEAVRVVSVDRTQAVPLTIVDLRIATDIADSRFLKEFEGAIDTYWRKNPSLRIRKVIWKQTPPAPSFESLDKHLKRFPTGFAVLTTGSNTTLVRNFKALILGPTPLTPRILAHEVGHLLGLPDCYVRTLTWSAFSGSEIVEWENPYFPDELMCNSNEGFSRSLEVGVSALSSSTLENRSEHPREMQNIDRLRKNR